MGWDGSKESCVRWGSTGAKGRCHANHFFGILMGYNFGCMIASDTLLDSMGWVFWVKLCDENIVEIERLRFVATATNFGTKIAITGFV